MLLRLVMYTQTLYLPSSKELCPAAICMCGTYVHCCRTCIVALTSSVLHALGNQWPTQRLHTVRKVLLCLDISCWCSRDRNWLLKSSLLRSLWSCRAFSSRPCPWGSSVWYWSTVARARAACMCCSSPAACAKFNCCQWTQGLPHAQLHAGSQNGTARHGTAQHGTAWHSTAQHSMIRHAQHSI